MGRLDAARGSPVTNHSLLGRGESGTSPVPRLPKLVGALFLGTHRLAGEAPRDRQIGLIAPQGRAVGHGAAGSALSEPVGKKFFQPLHEGNLRHQGRLRCQDCVGEYKRPEPPLNVRGTMARYTWRLHGCDRCPCPPPCAASAQSPLDRIEAVG